MSIPGQQNINVGLPNEPANSDSLYTAFTKTQDNFNALFACASPYNTFVEGEGISVSSNANTGTVTITNEGVTSIVAGDNIVVNQSNGEVTISATGSGSGGGGLSSVGVTPVSETRLVVTNSPLVTNGNISIDLANTGVTGGTYSNPILTVDTYGRVTNVANGAASGTVTSVGLSSGPGIQINGGPITSNGNITVTNTGVTRINPGAGIVVSSGNGNVTISTTSLGGTVTSVGVVSDQLVVSGSPVVTTGTINVNLPNTANFSGNVNANRINANGGNINGNLIVTGNVNAGNLVLATGNIIYTPRYGTFYSNVDQTNPVANTAMAMTFNNTGSANGVSVVSNSRLTIAKTGVYNIQFSAQVSKSGGGTSNVDIWLNKDGSPVAWTNTVLPVTSGTPQVAAWNFVENVTVANTYYEIMWSSPDTLVLLDSQAANTGPTRPGVPSVIVSVTPVGA